MRIIKFICLIVVIAVCLTGSSNIDLLRIRDSNAICFLTEKYGNTFYSLQKTDSRYSLDEYEARFIAEGTKGKEYGRARIRRDLMKTEYSDNYFGYLVREDYERAAGVIVRRCFDKAKVIARNPLIKSNNYKNKSQLYTAIKHKEDLYGDIHIYVYNKSKLSDKEFKAMCDITVKGLRQAGIREYATFYLVGKDVIGNINHTTYTDINNRTEGRKRYLKKYCL